MHLSRLENGECSNPFSDYFPSETLYVVTNWLPCYADIVNYTIAKTFPKYLFRAQKEKIRAHFKCYV